MIGGDVRPLTRGEPGVEGVFVAVIGDAVFDDEGLVGVGVENPLAIVGFEGWDGDAPGDLTRDVPIFELFEVIDNDLLFGRRIEFDLIFAERLDGFGGERFSFDEPLFFEEGFEDTVAFVTMGDRVSDFFAAAEKVLGLEVF